MKRIAIAILLTTGAAFAQQNLSSPVTALPQLGTGVAGEYRWRDATTSGNYVSLIGPQLLSGNVQLQWPSAVVDQSMVYIRGNVLYTSDPNIQWNYTNRFLNVTGTAGNVAINTAAGWIASSGGFVSLANSWQGINSPADGSLLRGYTVGGNISSTAGGYFDVQQIMYPPSGTQTCYDAYGNTVSQPIPLNGQTFGPNDVVIWNSPSPLQGYVGGTYHLNGTPCAPPITPAGGAMYTTGLNINAYIFSRVGFASDNKNYNTITLFNGGVAAQSLLAGGFYPAGTVTACCGTLTQAQYIGGYTATGVAKSPPQVGTIATVNNPFTSNMTQEPGIIYWDSTLGCENLATSVSTWSCLLTSAAPFTAPGSNTDVLYNSNGSVGASPSFTWNNTSQLLNVVATSASVAGINVQVGFVSSAAGFVALPGSCTSFNCIQTPTGGMEAKSFTASVYMQMGYGTSNPTPTANDSFNPGAFYYNTIANCVEVYSGSSFACLSGGTSSGVSSLNTLTGSLTLAGTTNEITVSPSGATITLATPQPIGTGSNVTFGDLTTGSNTTAGVLQTWCATSTSACIQTITVGSGGSTTPTQIDGLGDISTAGEVVVGNGIEVTGYGVSSGNPASSLLMVWNTGASTASILAHTSSGSGTPLLLLGSEPGTASLVNFIQIPAPGSNLYFHTNSGFEFNGASIQLDSLASSAVQCVQASAAGLLSGTGSACGSGSGGANPNGYYVVTQSTNAPSNAVNLGALSTGILKISVSSSVATISDAVSGTDYAPATTGSSILKGNGAGGFASAVANTDYLAVSGPTFTGTLTGPSLSLSSTLSAVAATFSGTITTNLTGGGTQCVQINNSGVMSGTGSACGTGTGGGVTNLNGLTGTLSIAGTSNEITVNPSGTTITLSTPQPIATTSAVTWASSTEGSNTAAGVDQVWCVNATTPNCFQLIQVGSGGSTIPLSMDGEGDLSMAGKLNITSTSSTSLQLSNGGSISLTGGTNSGSVQTNGTTAGFVANTSSGFEQISMTGSVFDVINSAGTIIFNVSNTTNQITTNLGNGTSTQCVQVSAAGVLSGTGSTCGTGGGGGGVTSLNTQTGALTIAGTTNEITVTSGTGTLTLSTPQAIATTSTPTFSTLTLTGNSSTTLSLTGTGAISAPGGILSAGTGSVLNSFGSAGIVIENSSGGTVFSAVSTGTITTNITGSAAQCVQASSAGVLSGTGSACGTGSGGGVTSITGTANEVLANGTSGSGQTGSITLTTPQAIGTGSTPTFSTLTLSGTSASTLNLSSTGGIALGSGGIYDNSGQITSANAASGSATSYTTLGYGALFIVYSSQNSFQVVNGTITTNLGNATSTQCLQVTAAGVLQGAGAACGTPTGGVTTLNGLSGGLTINNGSTTNQITVAASGTTISLTLPQGIGTGSAVSFATLSLSGSATNALSLSGTGGITLASGSITLSSGGSVVTSGASAGLTAVASGNQQSIVNGGGIQITNSAGTTIFQVTNGSTPTITTNLGNGTGAQCMQISSTGVLSGTGSACGSGTGGGVTSLNGLSNGVTIAAVSSQTTLSVTGQTINIGAAQNIATSSSPSFAGLTVSGTGVTALQMSAGGGITLLGGGSIYTNGATAGLSAAGTGSAWTNSLTATSLQIQNTSGTVIFQVTSSGGAITTSFTGGGTQCLDVSNAGVMGTTSGPCASFGQQVVTQSGASATFNLALGNLQKITLSASVTSVSVNNPGSGGYYTFEVCEPSGSTSYAFTFPTAFHNAMAIDTTATPGKCNSQTFTYDGNAGIYVPLAPGMLNF